MGYWLLSIGVVGLMGSCATADIAGPMEGNLSYGSHFKRTLFGTKSNLQKLDLAAIEDISGDLKAMEKFTPVAIQGEWVIGNYHVVKLFGYLQYDKAAKVKKDIFRDVEKPAESAK
jgi:hypothetical protein